MSCCSALTTGGSHSLVQLELQCSVLTNDQLRVILSLQRIHVTPTDLTGRTKRMQSCQASGGLWAKCKTFIDPYPAAAQPQLPRDASLRLPALQCCHPSLTPLATTRVSWGKETGYTRRATATARRQEQGCTEYWSHDWKLRSDTQGQAAVNSVCRGLYICTACTSWARRTAFFLWARGQGQAAGRPSLLSSHHNITWWIFASCWQLPVLCSFYIRCVDAEICCVPSISE